MDSAAASIVDLSGAPVPWPAHAEAFWADCIGQAARVGNLWTTPAPRGDEVIREWIAADQGFDPEQVTIVSSLRAAAVTYARRFDHVILEQPTFLGVMPALTGSRAEVRMAPWSEILDGTLGAEPGRTVLWLTSPCRNPDGVSLSPADETALARRAAAGFRVVVNATYTWFAEHKAPAGVDGVDVLGSLHKLRGVGARLGWVAGSSFFDEAVPELVGNPPSRVWQRGWGLFLSGGGMAMLRETFLADVAAAAAAFADRLASAHGIALPEFDGPSVLLPLLPEASEDIALADLGRRGFKLVAGRYFESRYPSLRATFFGTAPQEAARFADALAASGLLAA